MKRLLIAVTSLVIPVAVLAAKTTTWQGAAEAGWNVDGNWTDGVPGSGDTVILTGTSSVNDIADLTLASLQFAGDAAVTLSGNAITLTASDTSLTTTGAGTFTVAAPLVLSEGTNTFDIGQSAFLELTGAISGAGCLRFKGVNTKFGINDITRETPTHVLESVAKLRAANTYTGGTLLAGAHVQVFDNGCFGAAGADIAFEKNGSYVNILFLRAAGTFPYDITALATAPRILNSETVELTGDITETSTTATTLYIGNGKNSPNVQRNLEFRGTVNIPKVTVESYGLNDYFRYYGKVTAASFKGNGGATGGTAYVWLYNTENAVGSFNGSGSVEMHCGETNVVKGLTLGWSGYIGGSEFYMDGKDQEIKDFAWSMRTASNYLGAEWWTKMEKMCVHSSSPATLTMKASKTQVTDTGFDTNVSFVYDPAGDFTLTVISNRTHKMTGLLAAKGGTLKVTGFATFKDATGVAVSNGATMDFSEQTVDPFTDRQVDFVLATGATLAMRPGATWKAKTLTVGGDLLKPGNYTHANLPEIADNGGTLAVPFAGGVYVYETSGSVADLQISGRNEVTVEDGVTVTFLEAPTQIDGGILEVTTVGTGKVVCEAAKGVEYKTWFTLNGLTAQFNDTTGVLEPNDYSTAGDKALVQNTAEAKTDDLGGATKSVDAVARLAGTGDYTIENGTVSAAGTELVLENRDTAGDLAIEATFAPGSALLRKLGVGTVVLPSSTWSATAQIDGGAVAIETTTGRLVVTTEPSQAKVELSAADGAASVNAIEAKVTVTTDEKATVKILDVRPPIDVSAVMTVKDADLTFVNSDDVRCRVGNADTTGKNVAGLSELNITNSTVVQTTANMIIGGNFGDGIVRIQAGSVVTNKVVVGNYGHTGALYVHGGNLFSRHGSEFGGQGGSNQKLGVGYTEVRDNGVIEMTGYQVMSSQGYNDGIIDVEDGTVQYKYVAGASSYYRFVACTDKGRSEIRVGRGGVFDLSGIDSATGDHGCWFDGASDGSATVTARDGGQVKLPQIYLHRTAENSLYGTTLFNAVDGGSIEANWQGFTGAIPPSVYDYDTRTWLKFNAFINLNGGTYRGPLYGAINNTTPPRSHGPRLIDRVIVYEKGGTLQATAQNQYWHTPFVPATGNGIAEIPWASAGGFIAPPLVKIEGDGEAASASALFDSATGYVTNIVVNAPGIDYTWATAVVTRAGVATRGDVIARIPCTLAPNSCGSLVISNSPTPYVSTTFTVPELVITNQDIITLCDYCISSNTVVTFQKGGRILLTNGGGKGCWHPHFAPKAYRGEGSFGWQWEDNIFVSGFPVEGAPKMTFGGLTNNLENTWIVDCKAYAERKAAGLETENYPAIVNITDGAKITFVNTKDLKPKDSPYTLLTVSGEGKGQDSKWRNYEILGNLPEIADDSEPLGSWRLMKVGNTIKLKYVRGMMLIVR